MIWLIFHLDLLQEGQWPPDPKGSGYIDAPIGKKSGKHKAYFETPCQFAAEVGSRLKTTGEAGEALVDEIIGGIPDYEGLSRPAKRALNYISGWRRRDQSYPEWKADRKRR